MNNPLVKWVFGNKRLLFSYMMVAAIIVIGSFVINLWGKNLALKNQVLETKNEVVVLSHNVATYQKLIDTQQFEINTLRNIQRNDREYVKGLEADNSELKRRYETVEARVDRLKRENKTVRDFFDTAIPKVLNGL